jgi:hypothetical protein
METVLTAKLENMQTNLECNNVTRVRLTKHQRKIVSHRQTVFAKKGLLIAQTILARPVRPERLKIRQGMDCAVHARQENQAKSIAVRAVLVSEGHIPARNRLHVQNAILENIHCLGPLNASIAFLARNMAPIISLRTQRIVLTVPWENSLMPPAC